MSKVRLLKLSQLLTFLKETYHQIRLSITVSLIMIEINGAEIYRQR